MPGVLVLWRCEAKLCWSFGEEHQSSLLDTSLGLHFGDYLRAQYVLFIRGVFYLVSLVVLLAFIQLEWTAKTGEDLQALLIYEYLWQDFSASSRWHLVVSKTARLSVRWLLASSRLSFAGLPPYVEAASIHIRGDDSIPTRLRRSRTFPVPQVGMAWFLWHSCCSIYSMSCLTAYIG